MEGELSLQINVNLQKLAMISVAKSLWQTAAIIEKIKNSCDNPARGPNYRIYYTIAQKVIENKNSLTLPEVTSKNLDEAIIFVGENLFRWIDYVKDTLGLPFSYAEKIFWTSTGDIDDKKIYQLSWLRMGFLNLSNHSYFIGNDNSIYILASIYTDARFLLDAIPEMTYEMRRLYPDVNIDNYRDKIYTFITLWLYFNFKDKVRGMDDISFSRSDYIIHPKQMLYLCVDQGLLTAAEYYFNKMNVNERHENVVNFAKMLRLQNYRRTMGACSNWLYLEVWSFSSKKSSEILIFLVKNMEDEQRHTFITKYFPYVVKAQLHKWLFPELIMSFFNFEWSNVEEGEFNIDYTAYAELLTFILEYIETDINFGCPIKKPIYNFLLYKVWEKIPSNLKPQVITFAKNARPSFFDAMFKIFDLAFIKFMLTDPNIGEVGVKSIIKVSASECKVLIRHKKYFKVAQFITDVLSQEKWSHFLKKINLLEKLIEEDKFDVAEQILDMLANNHESKSRAELKSEIDGASICHKLIDEREFDLANKYIKWQFESEEELRSFKMGLKSDTEVICGIVHRIYMNKGLSETMIRERCFKCLMFYCESEEEVNMFRRDNNLDLLNDNNMRNLILGL